MSAEVNFFLWLCVTAFPDKFSAENLVSPWKLIANTIRRVAKRFPDTARRGYSGKQTNRQTINCFFFHSACNHDQYIQTCVLKGWLGTFLLRPFQNKKSQIKRFLEKGRQEGCLSFLFVTFKAFFFKKSTSQIIQLTWSSWDNFTQPSSFYTFWIFFHTLKETLSWLRWSFLVV